jgi:hypothetical protein
MFKIHIRDIHVAVLSNAIILKLKKMNQKEYILRAKNRQKKACKRRLFLQLN